MLLKERKMFKGFYNVFILCLNKFEGSLTKSHLFEVNSDVQTIVVHDQNYILN
jgi:hypothetical protein